MDKENPLDWTKILNPHREATIDRMRNYPVVLCLQDTTELDFNGQRIAGLGPLSYESQRGMYLHDVCGDTESYPPGHSGCLDVAESVQG